MKKNLSLLIISILSTFLLSGCSTMNITYDKYNIERNLNQNISKISSKSVMINDFSEEVIARNFNDKTYTFGFELEASKINNEIAKEFFSQYFEVINNKDSIFTVNTSLVNYSIYSKSFNPDNWSVDLTLKIEVIKEGKKILSKRYYEEAPDTVLYAGLRLSPEEMNFRKLQKGILYIYETKFKPDLLEALEKEKQI